jgi:hypothetical protein
MAVDLAKYGVDDLVPPIIRQQMAMASEHFGAIGDVVTDDFPFACVMGEPGEYVVYDSRVDTHPDSVKDDDKGWHPVRS